MYRALCVICLFVILGTGVVNLREGSLAYAAPIVAILISELLQRGPERASLLHIILVTLMTAGAVAIILGQAQWTTARVVICGLMFASALILALMQIGEARKRRDLAR